jgi:hypothetical protein
MIEKKANNYNTDGIINGLVTVFAFVSAIKTDW